MYNTCFINVAKKSPWIFQSISEVISFYENNDSVSKIKENMIQDFTFRFIIQFFPNGSPVIKWKDYKSWK